MDFRDHPRRRLIGEIPYEHYAALDDLLEIKDEDVRHAGPFETSQARREGLEN